MYHSKQRPHPQIHSQEILEVNYLSTTPPRDQGNIGLPRSRIGSQESNKVRPNAEDLVQTGHFMEEEEFSLFIMYLLQHTKHILEKKDKARMSSLNFNSIVMLS
jgi:hypothetical protein